MPISAHRESGWNKHIKQCYFSRSVSLAKPVQIRSLSITYYISLCGQKIICPNTNKVFTMLISFESIYLEQNNKDPYLSVSQGKEQESDSKDIL